MLLARVPLCFFEYVADGGGCHVILVSVIRNVICFVTIADGVQDECGVVSERGRVLTTARRLVSSDGSTSITSSSSFISCSFSIQEGSLSKHTHRYETKNIGHGICRYHLKKGFTQHNIIHTPICYMFGHINTPRSLDPVHINGHHIDTDVDVAFQHLHIYHT
jgi:hypothetical protein